ncbi:MAG: hypothetical protein ACRC3B_15450 [Bacteroidia bacterium]
MNRAYFFGIALAALSCNGDSSASHSPAQGETNQTQTTALRIPQQLDSLLLFKSEAELRKVFGENNLKYDTAWGPEGTNWLCTYLYQGTPDEVQITWQNETERSGIIMLKISAGIANDQPVSYKGRWKVKAGVLPGITLAQLEQLNAKPFMFSGFGWDYGGGVSGWDGGKLENSGISVQLQESPLIYESMEQNELARVLGDQQVSSSEPVLDKMNVQVLEVMLSPEIK